jgi:hypothetical protein
MDVNTIVEDDGCQFDIHNTPSSCSYRDSSTHNLSGHVSGAAASLYSSFYKDRLSPYKRVALRKTQWRNDVKTKTHLEIKAFIAHTRF